jgi:hypothetical protein
MLQLVKRLVMESETPSIANPKWNTSDSGFLEILTQDEWQKIMKNK